MLAAIQRWETEQGQSLPLEVHPDSASIVITAPAALFTALAADPAVAALDLEDGADPGRAPARRAPARRPPRAPPPQTATPLRTRTPQQGPAAHPPPDAPRPGALTTPGSDSDTASNTDTP